MAKTNLLKAKMAAAGDDTFIKTVAEILEITPGTASRKLAGTSSFKDQEIKKLAEKYGLTPEEIQEIFFEE